MFSQATLLLLVLLLLVSLVAHHPLLGLLSLALLLAAGLSLLWREWCLRGVEYRRRLSPRRAAFGETVVLELEVVNRKLLPLAWLEVEDELPRSLPPARGRVYPSHKADRSLLEALVALRPYERVRRRYPIPCVARGEHTFGPARLRSGDLFGLVVREEERPLRDTLVVLPRVVPLAELGLPARQPLGELRAPSWLFEDPTRIAGAREYQPGDSRRRIHWPASVRAQRLQSKVYEPALRHQLVIALNTHTAAAWWGFTSEPDALELSIMTAASIAAWAAGEGYQVGLLSNGFVAEGSLRGLFQPCAAGAGMLARLLETLGRLRSFAVRPFELVLEEHRSRLPFGAALVVVSAVVSPEIAAALGRLHRRGHPVTLVLTGAPAAAGAGPAISLLEGIAVRHVGPPEAWRRLAALHPTPVAGAGGFRRDRIPLTPSALAGEGAGG